MATLKSKRVSYGIVEIRETSSGYGLYINDKLKMQSSDLSFILNEYNKLY
jgi:hypothetical protein